MWQSSWQSFQVKGCLHTALSVQRSTSFFTVNWKLNVHTRWACFDMSRSFSPAVTQAKHWLWYFLLNHFLQILKAMQCIIHIQIFCNIWNEIQNWNMSHLLIPADTNSPMKCNPVYPNRTHDLPSRLVTGFPANRGLFKASDSWYIGDTSNFG